MIRFDHWLKSDGAAALVIREQLVPVEGSDGVFFPATFAAAEDKSKFAGGYNIDSFPDGTNVCIVDTVGSQANRLEPIFAQSDYARLIPQVVVVAGEKRINLVEAGHRSGDALIRCSALKDELQAAFKKVLQGNAEPLAKVAPTSLVFGVWDSRDTQAKLPRLVASTIRAFNVRKLTRSAQYVPAAEYVNDKLLDEPGEKSVRDAYAERGFSHVPSSGGHGGVIATGGIRRDATLGLAALRLLGTGSDAERTRALQRYVLGLCLLALVSPHTTYLRQGCNLVGDPERPREVVEVHGDGRRVAVTLAHDDVLDFARKAAEGFGVGPDREVAFDRKLAKNEISPKKAK
jgi:CRISPR-associated protein Csb1